MAAENPQTNNSTTTIPSLDGGAGVFNSPRRLPAAWAQVVRGESDTAAATTSSPKQSPPPPSADSVALAGSGTVYVQDSGLGQSNVASAAADETETTSQVVVGTSSEGNNGNAGSQKKAAWNKPLNGVAAAAEIAITPVMGAVSWPALSESTRPGTKSDASSSSKPVSDASLPLPQAPVIAQTPHKQAKPNVNANSNTNHNHNHNHGHGQPARQRSMKHRGNSSGGGNGGGGAAGGGSNSTGFARAPPPPTPPPFPLFEMPYGNMVPAAVLDSSQVRGEGAYKGGSTNSSWVARPMGHGVNDHSSHRRRGNFGGGGGRPRGDGPPYVNGYGGRHDQDHRDWHGPRGSNARDVHLPPHQMIPPPHAPRGLFRPAHLGAPPFMAPQAMRPFPGPMGFGPDIASQFLYLQTLPPEQFRGAPLIPHGTPMFFPVADPTLHTQIVNQIEYYFSEANLVKDNYLRSNMDDEGWVPVTLIANFPRVQSLTNDIQLILDCLRTSTVVEVQGDKVRRRNDWQKWAPASGRFPAESSMQSPGGASDTSLQIALQKLTVEETTTDLKTTLGSADTETEIVPITNGEVTAEACASHI